jgi:TatD DNase family protein
MTDAHIHLSFLKSAELPAFLHRSKSIGITRFLMAGYDPADWDKQQLIKGKYPTVKTCFGIHPWTLRKLSRARFEKFFDALVSVADTADLIGETGLDAFRPRTKDEKDLEVESFRRHLALAQQLKKPVVLHLVKDHARALKLIRDAKFTQPGLVHGYSGSPEMAKEYVKAGFLISIGPGILKANFKNLRRTAKELPLRNLIIESDQPENRDDRGHPDLLLQVISALAALRQEPQQEIHAQTEKNVTGLFSA